LNEAEHIFRDIAWRQRIKHYIVSRQNEDGGYTFCQGGESNMQDTYYALATLDCLEEKPPNLERTVKWLNDYGANSLHARYYAVKALMLCGQPLDGELEDAVLLHRLLKRRIDASDVYAEASSEFEDVFMIVELARIAKAKVDCEKTANWLLSFENEDGGFGVNGHSNLNATFHAVSALANLGYPVKSLKTTLAFARSCEKSIGGFTVTPLNYTPYMEHTYYGVFTLDLLGAKPRYKAETVNFVSNCQNSNGGFARSDLGISTFESTFQAVSIIHKLSRERRELDAWT